MSEEAVCVGPEALPGEIDGLNLLKISRCQANEDNVGCMEAISQFFSEAGCTASCVETYFDRGRRGQICDDQLSATCKTTAVPCDSDPPYSPPPIPLAPGVLMLLVKDQPGEVTTINGEAVRDNRMHYQSSLLCIRFLHQRYS